MLTRREILDYLIGQKLLDPKLILADRQKVIDASRRNAAYKVVCAEGPSYLVKQGSMPESTLTVAYEATVYRLLHSEIEGGISAYIPALHAYDARARLLVIELLCEAEDMRQYQAHHCRFPKSLGAAMGRVLGTLHGSTERGSSISSIPERIPWALTLHRPQLGIFREASAANLEVVKILQRSDEFGRHFDGLRQDWRANTLIHGDVKLDNWVVLCRSPGRRKLAVKLVDWEFAARGDACWDVASVFSAYFCFWLSSIPIAGPDLAGRFLELSRYPLERMQPAIASFWNAYTEPVTGRKAGASTPSATAP